MQKKRRAAGGRGLYAAGTWVSVRFGSAAGPRRTALAEIAVVFEINLRGHSLRTFVDDGGSLAAISFPSFSRASGKGKSLGEKVGAVRVRPSACRHGSLEIKTDLT